MTRFDAPAGNFRGHDKQDVWSATPDPELAEVGPGTPCGEYLRRFWMPVAMTDQFTDRPYRIRILGEDLVLFREKGGRLGLVHLHCAHRNMSLEFGIIEEGGHQVQLSRLEIRHRRHRSGNALRTARLSGQAQDLPWRLPRHRIQGPRIRLSWPGRDHAAVPGDGHLRSGRRRDAALSDQITLQLAASDGKTHGIPITSSICTPWPCAASSSTPLPKCR